MTTRRRLCAVVGGLGILAACAMLPFVHGQRIVLDEGNLAPFSNAVQLQTNRKAQQVMNAAEQLIQEEEWGQVVKALQSLLDTPDDAFIQVTRPGPDGKPIGVQTSIRSEANRMIGALPPEGLQFYEVSFGPAGQALLNDAKSKNDPQRFAEVARRYLHTEAGAEAVTILGTRFLDRNEPLHAALYFEKLMSRPGFVKQPAWTHLKAALAFHRAGDDARRDEVFKLLGERARREGGIRIGGQVIALDVIRQEMDRIFKPAPQAVNDYLVFRGSPNRGGQPEGSPPYMDRSWLRSLYAADAASKQWTEQALKEATRYLADQRGQPILSAFFPVAAGGKVIYRAYDGVYATNLRSYRDSLGKEHPPGDRLWEHLADGGLVGRVVGSSGLLADDKRGYLDQWKAHYQQYGPQSILFENSVLGTLSTDGQRVFFIDDLALPPHPVVMRNAMFGNAPNFGAMRDLVRRNSLKCINLETGKIVWQLSGKWNDRYGLEEFADSFFLGAPLPLGGKLYVLNEKNSELRLVCLECKDEMATSRPPEIIWKQTLANVRDKLETDLGRRMHAAHLAYGDGVLICPTNAGAVLAVDLLSHSLIWAHSYRETTDEAQPQGPPINRFRPQQAPVMNLANEWKVAAPAVVDGKVVFTAPDASSMHCLNLRDGRLLWKVNREADDLYFGGVYAGKALVVGKNYCKLVGLDDPKQVKRIGGTGIPTGQGVASSNVYYLPTRVGPEREPEVCAISLEKGEIVAHTKSRSREEPGNLIFHDGEVISQTIEHITAYPQLHARLRVIDEGIKKDPRNPVALIARGELRLDKGDLPGAYDDLHNALANNPPADLLPKARQKLYDTLTELLNRDFVQYEKHLPEYRELCQSNDADEQLRRQGNYLCLVGKGREQQGRLVEAFEAYMEFGALAGNQELVSVSDEPSTKSRPDVWARGRIGAMMAKASPQERQPLENLIRTRWDAIKDSSNLEQVRGFVRVFGSAFAVGREARLRLAEQLIAAADPQGEQLREAQLHLLQLRAMRSSDPQLAGRAVEALARLMEKKAKTPGQQSLMEHAAHYYRELGRDYANVDIRDGKTGADFFNEFTTDKRFLPFLEEPRQSWQGKFNKEVKTGQNPAGVAGMRPSFTMEPAGDVLPYFKEHRLVLDVTASILHIVNDTRGEEAWKLDGLALQYLTQGGHTNFRSVFNVQGHVVVAQLGHMVYAFDPVDKKKLWEFNLYEPGGTSAPKPSQVLRDRDGNLQILYADNWMQKLGASGPVQPTYVCVQTRDRGLVALEPLTGATLWTKSDVTARTSFFGDAEHVYLVETNEEGQASTATRAVRASDGVSITVPDFTQVYDQRLAILGRTILLRDQTAAGERVRLYDVASGRDVCHQVYPAGSKILKSEEDRLTGGIAPDGTLTVFDLVTRKEVLKTNLLTESKEPARQTLTKEELARLQEAYLVADRDLYYVVMNNASDANLNGGPLMSVFPGIRCLPVNGTVAAYDRGTGQRRWFRDDVANQMLVLEQFDQLPVLFFTARHNRWQQNGPNRFSTSVMEVKVVHRSSGKLVLDHSFPQNVNPNQFHLIKADPRLGVIEMVSFNTMVRLVLERPGETSAARAALTPSQPSSIPVAQPAVAPQLVPVRVEVAPVQRR